MKGIIGKKIGMTQIFDETGQVVPVTVIEVGPCYVTQVKTPEVDGYSAIQLGFEADEASDDVASPGALSGAASKQRPTPTRTRGRRALNLPERGHLRSLALAGVDKDLRILKEFRVQASDLSDYQVGQVIQADIFSPGQRVDVIGTSKGRGFAGVIKRHGFRRQPKTHGQTDRTRAPGAIGACTWPGRVWKGKKMPGHMGNVRKTVQNLLVILADSERNLLLVRGGVPGPNGGLVLVQQGRKQ